MGKKSQPPPPDYVGMAQTQADANKDLTTEQTWANRANQTNPWGSTSWDTKAVVDPATGKTVTQWTQDTQLDPRLQQALNSQVAIQQGRSDLAAGMMARSADEYSQPMDWSKFGAAQAGPQGGNLQATTSPYAWGPRQTTTPWGGPQQTTQANGGGIAQTTQAGGPGLQATTSATGGGIAPQTQASGGNLQATTTGAGPQVRAQNPFAFGGGQVQGIDTSRGATPTLSTNLGQGAGQVQSSLDYSGAPGVDKAAETRKRAEDAIYQASTSRLDPMWQQRQADMESSLANRGITAGSDLYTRAMADMERSRNDAYQQAMLGSISAGGTEAQRDYGMDMGLRQQYVNEQGQLGQFANSAQAQQFGQLMNTGQANNAALGQQFGLDQQARGDQINAQQALFGQQQAAGQYGMGQQAQQFGQQLQAAQYGTGREAQAFGQQQGIDASQLSREQQAYQQQLASGQFGLGQQQQAFGQAATAQQQALSQQQQAYQQALSSGQYGLGQQQQAFGQAATADQQAMARQQQAYQQQLAQQQFGLGAQQQAFGQQQQAGAQNFNQQLQASQFQNQQRQQAIQEEMQRRGFSLNEINAILSGQQVATPQFSGYNTAGVSQAADLVGAADMGYQAQVANQNASNAATGQALGTAASMAMMFSDRRLKKDVRLLRRDPRGFGVYSYRFIGEHGAPRVGVMAQEIRRFVPQAAANDGGVWKVDYRALGLGELAA